MIKNLILSLVFISCLSSSPDGTLEIIVGAEKMDQYLEYLNDKSVALIINQTSQVKGVHLLDTLVKRNISISKIFALEHGFRGDVPDGATISDTIDAKTGVPIVSLYGRNKKLQPGDLVGVDVVVFDLQDVGTRFYTYISSMQLAMEACAENEVEFMVFDRPNPNGLYVDGPIRLDSMKSFVGMAPIPILHGMTIGELATIINEEGWLLDGIKCRLKIIKMDNYRHSLNYNLPVKPSPNLPNDLAIKLYPSLCLFEGTIISVGRGTYAPFTQIGHPYLKGKNYQHSFTPVSIPDMSKWPPYENKECYGIDFSKTEVEGGLNLGYLIEMYNQFMSDNFFNAYFDKLAGTAELRRQILTGLTEKEIKESWQSDLEIFKNLRAKYLLYDE